ncbi:hypothetical protein AVEN_54145-1 [Araneus ventricosus]|uniref:Uncharacterized protein n=1 Tax=Araneus ventricosus TaxID=182803 RepID=A0A4Y2BVE8_ARAVE|nr:hypothetical protein AVEN_54145-1 [Araneus ventricosus]
MDLVILKSNQTTWTRPELAPPPHTTSAEGRLASYVQFNVQQAHIQGGSSVDLGFEPGNLQPRSRDLTTRPPRPIPAYKMGIGGNWVSNLQPIRS